MSTKIVKRIRFKPYSQDVSVNVAVSVQELVSENALAQIIHQLVEGIDLLDLEPYYQLKGSPAYHPKMLLKVWLYGYCTQVYTSRPLAQKLRQDLVLIWLSGGQRPCFKTLSSFRSVRMGELMDSVVSHVLMYLVEQGYIDLGDLYVDGSKWAANANKYKIIWRKNTQRYKEQVLSRIKTLLSEIDQLQAQEDTHYGSQDLPTHQSREEIALVLSSEDIEAHLSHLSDLVKAESEKKKKRRYETISRHLGKEQEKLEKYEAQEQVLDKRNSYSKTDEDATALRMKDEQLLPAYNVQISSSNQFIVNSTIHRDASDYPTFPSHVEKLEERVEPLVEAQTVQAQWQKDYSSDAGYGSEENYELLQDKGFTAYLKYGYWYQQHTGKIAKKTFHSYNWPYDPERDAYLCPNGEQLDFREEIIRTTATGYQRHLRVYQASQCADCPLAQECKHPKARPESNRTIYRNPKLEHFTQQARERLASQVGQEKRSRRSVEVETPFANIKHNMKHRRFILRGKEKVQIEFNFLALAHNIKKIFCLQTGIWQEYYAQRAARKAAKA